MENVRKCGFAPARIKKILLTHAHWDHVGGLASFLRRVDAEVYGHALAKETLAGEPGIYVCAHAWQMSPGLERAPVHQVVKEGDVIQAGELTVKVCEAPGHTPDGLAFTFAHRGGTSCFSGDTAIGDQGEVKGNLGWLDTRWRSKLSHYKTTLERLRTLGFSELFPGHGVPHLGQAAVQKSLDNCLWRLNLLLSIPHLGSMLPPDLL